jgi:high affinity sulfate transporter 1
MSTKSKNSNNVDFMNKFFPITTWLPKYKRSWLSKDIVAGLSVWALMVPQSLGYASISGVPVQYGLYAAAIGLIAYAIFATSKHVVTGPSSTIAAVSGAAALAVGTAGSSEAIAIVASVSILAGLMYIVLALFKMGWVSNFLAASVLTGFIFGIGIDVIIGQLGKITGTTVTGHSAWSKSWSWLTGLSDTNMATLAVGVGSLVLLYILHKFLPKIPGALVALIIGIGVSTYFNLSSEGVKIVGDVPTGLPSFALPSIDFFINNMPIILPAAIGVLMIALSESIATARLYATKHHYQVDINQEMLAQGVANTTAGLFQGISVAGSLSKSSLNDSSGAKSQVSSLAQGGFVLLTLLLLAPIFTNLPDAVLGAIVIIAVGYGLLNVKEMKRIYKYDRAEFWVAMVALFGVITFGTLQGVIIGLILSILVLIWLASKPSIPEVGKVPETGQYRNVVSHPNAKTIPGVVILKFESALFFANETALSNRIHEIVSEKGSELKIILLDMQSVNHIDLEGSDVLHEIISELSAENKSLHLVNMQSKIKKYLSKTGVIKAIGEKNIYINFKEAEQKLS